MILEGLIVVKDKIQVIRMKMHDKPADHRYRHSVGDSDSIIPAISLIPCQCR